MTAASIQLPRSRSSRRGAALLVSLALHLGVIAFLVDHVRSGAGTAVPSAQAMSVRMVAATSSPVESPAPAETSAATSPDAATPRADRLPSATAPLTPEPSRDRPAEPARDSPSRRVAAAEYLGVDRLDPGPRPLDDIEPVYPPEAGMQEGVVALRILVNEGGGIDGIQAVRSNPPGLFERSAVDAFANVRFSPGQVSGRPVKSQITIELTFQPYNRGAAVSGRGY